MSAALLKPTCSLYAQCNVIPLPLTSCIWSLQRILSSVHCIQRPPTASSVSFWWGYGNQARGCPFPSAGLAARNKNSDSVLAGSPAKNIMKWWDFSHPLHRRESELLKYMSYVSSTATKAGGDSHAMPEVGTCVYLEPENLNSAPRPAVMFHVVSRYITVMSVQPLVSRDWAEITGQPSSWCFSSLWFSDQSGTYYRDRKRLSFQGKGLAVY